MRSMRRLACAKAFFICILVATAAALTLPSTARAAGTQDMWRLYNPYTGEHLYTASTVERNALVTVGWEAEGVGWVAPTHSGTPVYRLYNPYVNGGDHHYTTSEQECYALVDVGWIDEGICWYSDDAQTIAIRRQYNPYATTGTHNYTPDANEAATLVSRGWKDEGTGWYAVARGDVTTSSGGITVTGPSGFTGTAEFQRLKWEISSVYDAGRDIGFVLYDMQTGRKISCGSQTLRYTASSVKAMYSAWVYERYGSAGGARSLVEDALVDSSNSAYSTLVRRYGFSGFRSWLSANGASGVYVPSGSYYAFISADEAANVWEHIWRNSLMGGSASSELGGFLSRTHHSAMGGLLRKRYVTWSKPGWYPTDGSYTSTNDMGIVFSDCGPYVLVVMTNYPENFGPLFSIVDAANAAHGKLCGGSTESLMGGGVSLS